MLMQAETYKRQLHRDSHNWVIPDDFSLYLAVNIYSKHKKNKSLDLCCSLGGSAETNPGLTMTKCLQCNSLLGEPPLKYKGCAEDYITKHFYYLLSAMNPP